MKKILILETSAFNGRKSGGSFIQATYYKKKLQNNGYRVDQYIGDPKSNKYRRFIQVIKKIREADYIIGFGTPLLAIYLQWLSFIFGKKGIFCIDTIIASIEIINDYLKKKIYPVEMIFQNLKAFFIHNISSLFIPPKLNLTTIASSNYVRSKLENSRLFPEEKEFLYPRVSLSKERRIKNQSHYILFYGTLFRGRGIFDLIEACRILWKKNYDFKLIILGWPIVQITKETLIKEIKRGEEDKILLKGFVKNPVQYVKKTAVVVLPFHYPCSFQVPYTLLEPMGLGVPVITTDVGSHREWIINNKTGLLCEKENPQDIADKIETVFTDKKLVERITQGAYRLLEERYKEKDVLLEVLERLENER